MESNVSCTFAGRNEDWAEIDKSPTAAAANNGNGGGGIPRAGLGIAERRAAKSGFSLGSTRLNTARIRTWTGIGIGTGSNSPPVNQHSPPTCFTISPGISPTALLDSPVMLPNSQGQISPTTGTFSVASFADDASVVHSAIPTKDDGDEGVPGSFTFSFNHARYPSSNSVFMAMEPYQGTVVDRNGFSVQDPFMQVDFLPDIPTQDGGEKNFTVDLPSGIENLSNMSLKTEYRDSLPCSSDGSSSQTIPKSEANDREENPDFENAAGGGDNKETYSSLPGMSRNSEDGYNWRKYGQKQVKGSEFPRSYYKCTHPSCPVKKNVERSLAGQIAEIIYKGAHNHPKPQPARHGMIPTAFSLNKMPEMSEGAETFIKVGSESQIWRNDLIGSMDIGPPGSEWRSIGLERTPSISLMTDLSDTAATKVQGKSIGVFDPVKTPELSSAMASHNDGDEDGATQGSFSPGEDADDDELESKRRRSENCFVEASLSTRAVREPRVVIQIESEIDILDDGYRWRKYGQKVVKGNPNPRSYYKCTSTGCPVRKHVERASNDLKCIVTTYEGKHIHEVPVARNGCHVPSSSGNLGPGSATGQTYLSMPRNSVMPKQETQAHAIALLDRKPEFANEFLRSSLLVNFGNDMRCGTTSLFPVKYPPLQNSVPCGPYRLIPSQSAVHAPGSIAALVPEFPISMPFKYQQLRNVPMNGLEIHHHSGKAATAFSYHPSIPGQCVKEEVKYLAPKQERDDGLFQACIPVMDPPSASPSSMLWPLIGGYPT